MSDDWDRLQALFREIVRLPLDARALRRCAAEDTHAAVAAQCRASRPASGGRDDVLIFVVPDGRTEPTPRAPFALVRPDGTLRLGVADRRGGLFERGAPRGELSLAVPAALAR